MTRDEAASFGSRRDTPPFLAASSLIMPRIETPASFNATSNGFPALDTTFSQYPRLTQITYIYRLKTILFLSVRLLDAGV